MGSSEKLAGTMKESDELFSLLKSSTWSRLTECMQQIEIAEALGEENLGEAEEVDYDTPIHPALMKARQALQGGIDWIAGEIDKSGTPEMKRLADELKKVPSLPSDQVMPKLKAISDKLHDAGKAYARLPIGNPNSPKGKHMKDVLSAVPGLMKQAGQLASSSTNDKGLWQKKIKGYVDDKTGNFVIGGIQDVPTGMDKDDIKLASDKSDGKTPPPRPTQTVKPTPKPGGFFIRKKGE